MTTASGLPDGPHVAAIGGGHGLAVLLRAARTYAGRVTAVVSTADDGGSSGRLRQLMDLPAPGDLRRCLTAVGDREDVARALEHRFDRGELAGHAVGNLVLAGLVDAGHQLDAAADVVAGWLGVPESVRVLPATVTPVELVAATPAGQVRGQVEIEEAGELKHLTVEPAEPQVLDAVRHAIEHGADQVVLGPGSFYTSVLAAAVVPGMRRAIEGRRGPLVFVCNLRAAETNVRGFDIARHVAVLRDHGLRPDVVVTQAGALPVGALDGVELIEADIDRPHGLAHDPELLGAVLAAIT